MGQKIFFWCLFSFFLGHFRAGIFLGEIIYFTALDLRPVTLNLRPALSLDHFMGSTGINLLHLDNDLDNCLASRSYWGLLMLVSYQTYESIYLLVCTQIYIYISSGFFGSSGLLAIHINSLVY